MINIHLLSGQEKPWVTGAYFKLKLKGMKYISIILIFLLSCNTNDPQPSTGSIVFTIDGTKHIGTQTAAIIMKEINGDRYMWSIIGMTENDESHSVIIGINSQAFEVNNYPILNYIDYSSYYTQNNIGYGIGKSGFISTLYSNILCDASFQAGSNYGSTGYITITSINKATMSGKFDAYVCLNETTHARITGYFNNLPFDLME